MTCVNILDIGKLFRKKFFQDIGDKRIEVVGLENCLHMGQVGDNAWMMDEWCFGWWWMMNDDAWMANYGWEKRWGLAYCSWHGIFLNLFIISTVKWAFWHPIKKRTDILKFEKAQSLVLMWSGKCQRAEAQVTPPPAPRPTKRLAKCHMDDNWRSNVTSRNAKIGKDLFHDKTRKSG